MKGKDSGVRQEVDDRRRSRRARSKPVSTVSSTSCRSEGDEWQKFLIQSKTEFVDRYQHDHTAADLTVKDFDLIATIGKGAFGTVVVARSINSDEYYAIKIIEKATIVKSNQIEQTAIEKRMLLSIKFPFIISMDKYFKDNTYVYFVMPYIVGGEMFSVLRKTGRLDERSSVFYAAQVVLAFEYLHYLDVVYRDLKPENLIFDETGYIKIIDLGFTKIVRKRTYTLCGTPDYLAPEVILSKGYAHAVDWWALGVLIYEMCSGIPPFFARDVTQTYERIVKRAFKCPFTFSEPLRDILDKLLQVDVTRRLGNLKGGVNDIKSHVWFASVGWMDIFHKRIKPPYIPNVKGKGDIKNFDGYEELVLRHHETDQYSQQLAGFL